MSTYVLPSPATQLVPLTAPTMLDCNLSEYFGLSCDRRLSSGTRVGWCMYVWQCDKRQMSDLNWEGVERRRGGNGPASAKSLAVGGDRESQRQQRGGTCIIDNLCFLSIEFMTFSLCNLLFLASAEDGSGPGCELAAWMEMAEQSISLARRMWRGRKCQGSLDIFFFFPFSVALLPRGRSVADKSSEDGRQWGEETQC